MYLLTTASDGQSVASTALVDVSAARTPPQQHGFMLMCIVCASHPIVAQDGGGDLNSKDLKVALRSLQESFQQVGAKTKDLEKVVANQRVIALEAQLVMNKQMTEDEQVAREEKERIEQEKREKTEAAEAAMSQKSAVVMAKAEIDAKKKAEFEARVAARRNAAGSD